METTQTHKESISQTFTLLFTRLYTSTGVRLDGTHAHTPLPARLKKNPPKTSDSYPDPHLVTG